MNVKEVMSREVRSIRLVDRLDAAARLMWEGDCGIAPVVDGNHALVGVVTDRDLCMAAWTQGRPLGDIPVTAVMARQLRTCKPDDGVAGALATMQQHQLHRLPVVDARGVLVGMLAIGDLLRLAGTRPAALDGTLVVRALAAIKAPRAAARPAAPAKAAAPAAPAGTPAPAAGAASAAAIPAVPPATASAAARTARPKTAPKPKGGKKS